MNRNYDPCCVCRKPVTHICRYGSIVERRCSSCARRLQRANPGKVKTTTARSST